MYFMKKKLFILFDILDIPRTMIIVFTLYLLYLLLYITLYRLT